MFNWLCMQILYLSPAWSYLVATLQYDGMYNGYNPLCADVQATMQDPYVVPTMCH